MQNENEKSKEALLGLHEEFTYLVDCAAYFLYHPQQHQEFKDQILQLSLTETQVAQIKRAPLPQPPVQTRAQKCQTDVEELMLASEVTSLEIAAHHKAPKEKLYNLPLQIHGDTFNPYVPPQHDTPSTMKLYQPVIERTDLFHKRRSLCEQSGSNSIQCEESPIRAQNTSLTHSAVVDTCLHQDDEYKIEIGVAMRRWSGEDRQCLAFEKGEKILLDRSVQAPANYVFGRVHKREGFLPLSVV